MNFDSGAKTDVSNIASQADIKYVNVLYNTKAAQNGLAEGPTKVDNEVSDVKHFLCRVDIIKWFYL